MGPQKPTEVTLQACAPDRSAGVRSPFLAYRNILGAQYVAGLLDYVARRQPDFKAGGMYDRQVGECTADLVYRDAVYLTDLGPFANPIKSFVKTIAVPALKALHLSEAKVEPKEFVITAYRDGGHIGEHIDTYDRPERVRILSCVYYFATNPRRFSGGELRLYGFPKSSVAGGSVPTPFADIKPYTDTLVVFPSWIRHQVMPVCVPSKAWLDSRFTINCWMHRASDQPRART
jgi:SM-20-related protein